MYKYVFTYQISLLMIRWYPLYFQDRYLLISMLFNYLVCIWHIIVSRFEDDRDSQSSMDLYAFIATIIIYVAYQLSFLIIVTIKVNHYKLRNIYVLCMIVIFLYVCLIGLPVFWWSNNTCIINLSIVHSKIRILKWKIISYRFY